MSLRIHLFPVNALPIITTNPRTRPPPITALFTRRLNTQIPCTNKTTSGYDLASEFAKEVTKINTHMVQREEAMRKSKELLFVELCGYLALEEEEVRRKWRKLDREEKWVLVKEFVDEWSANFHPLSARSVQQMIEEYVTDDDNPPSSVSVSELFPPGLKRMIGFS
ncbi:hypothetical protein Tsubulata_002899 [Turnera subulata]|uniref:DUF7026 domain-containing protein n=1 Tax=Turnera subulata TaxID=218843 RepID=A0A9Q0G486_9ROSI|nr:hypothetical protein Tsubulata_002899 [Turnera subulata]